MNHLSAAQLERFAILSEELGEAQQIVGKILRHGLSSRDPTRPDSLPNSRLLEIELGDIEYAIDLLVRSGELKRPPIYARKRKRRLLVAPYIHWKENL